MSQPKPLPIKLRGVYPPPRVPIPLRLLFMTLSLVVIATVAVTYSLGYQMNWQAGTSQQTGIIAVATGTGVTAQTYLNGKEAGDHFPVRVSLLFPGKYNVEVKRDGYQPWVWYAYLQPNSVVAVPDLVIVKNLSQVTTRLVSAVPQPGPNNGLEARVNELWVNGQFMTRLSQKILSVQWYPDNAHIAYQAGSDLELYDTVTGITLDLAVLPDATPVTFGFQDGGRTLVYQSGGKTYAATLYEQ